MNSDKIARCGLAIGAVVTAFVVAVTAWGSMIHPASVHHANETSGPVLTDTLELLPSATLTDWATYGDVLAQVTIHNTVVLPASDGDTEQAYLPRGMVLDVDKILWRRASSDASALPAQLHVQLDGWTGAHRRPIQPSTEPHMAVGHSYLVLLTHLVPSKHVLVEQWAPTGLKAIIPFQSGVLNVSDQAPGNESRTDLRAEMTGRSAEELTSALASTPVDPKAAPYMSLPPDERYQLAEAS
jgi:hypothetical protein